MRRFLENSSKIPRKFLENSSDQRATNHSNLEKGHDRAEMTRRHLGTLHRAPSETTQGAQRDDTRELETRHKGTQGHHTSLVDYQTRGVIHQGHESTSHMCVTGIIGTVGTVGTVTREGTFHMFVVSTIRTVTQNHVFYRSYVLLIGTIGTITQEGTSHMCAIRTVGTVTQDHMCFIDHMCFS